MRYGDLQFIDIIIFAVITIFLIIRLKNILGSRGNLKKDNTVDLKIKEQNIEQKPDNQHIPELSENISKLEKAYEVLENFDHKGFIDGAKAAFETIITSFNKGDKQTLKNLLTKEVYQAFEKEINNKNIDPNNQFFSLNIEKVENVTIKDNIIRISIKFISEQFKNNDESTVIKKEDNWTFEKQINSKHPNWLLSST